MSEWQPIETAPKTRTPVLVTWHKATNNGCRPAFWWEAAGVWVDNYSGDELANLTHWMPLPEPPK